MSESRREDGRERRPHAFREGLGESDKAKDGLSTEEEMFDATGRADPDREEPTPPDSGDAHTKPGSQGDHAATGGAPGRGTHTSFPGAAAENQGTTEQGKAPEETRE